MSDLDVAVARTTGEHTAALNWFRDNAGRTVSWPEIQAQAELRTRLVTQAKGIYADSDEAAPLFRDDCAPGFRDDLAPLRLGSCWL